MYKASTGAMTKAEILAALEISTLTNSNTGDQTLSGLGAKPAALRVVSTTDDATAVIDCTITDVYVLTAVANATEFTITGTPVAEQQILIKYKDAGAAKGLTFTGISPIGITLPTTTTQSKWGYVLIAYSASGTAWHALATGTEA